MENKELIELAEKGLLSKDTQRKAMKAYYFSIAAKCPTVKDAVMTTANKFGVSESTVRNTVLK